MAVNLTRFLVLFSVFCVLARTAVTLNIDNVKKWANKTGEKLQVFFDDATSFKKLQEAYRSSQLKITKKNGSSIVNGMKNHLQGVLEKKIKSIKNLAEKTEILRDNYTYRDPLEAAEVEYFNSKNLSKGLTLEIDPKFSPSIKINKNSSVVHIPTDVYSGGVKILNTIKWTDGLDPYFKENDKQDPSLLWQYFGSSDGVYRVYPGFGWPDKSENDVFDNRRRGWYIQGSSSPKDLVLLLDLSGSMAGQKLSILKLAAMSLLETLQENDFVNIVVVFANDDSDNDDNEVNPYMVCQVKKDGSVEKNREKVAHCSDHLLQATQQNKKYLKNFIPNVKARGIAAVSKGFERAIEVLKNSQREKRNFTSSGCTQAIILFTDGIEDSQAEKTTEILQEKNAGKQIRVFTYLLGREKSATDKPLRKITNEYRGCFFRIKTLSDVREKVLAYVTVLSRPLGFAVADTGPDPSWTPIYYDKLGLGLMITLVAPVFNRTKDRELLGVVGTDVALPQLEASVPGSEVGVNGYGFAINNNGFLVFHPSLNKEWVEKYCEPAKEAKLADKKVKDPPNIALDEVEYNAVGAEKLTRKMIDRLTGNMTFQNRLISEHKHRLSWSEEFHYFYSPVENTSFSAAIAIPKSSLYSLDASGFTDLNPEFLKSSAENEFVVVAPWKICPHTPVAADSETPVYLTAYPTAQDIINDDNLNPNCNDQKLKNLLFDANATKEAAARYWNAEDNSKGGIDNVFVATHGGIMRWLNSSSLASPLKRNYTKEEFYTQAAQYADKGEKERIIVFSAPYRAADYEPDVNETATITASSPVVLTEDTNVVVAAVAGMHVKHEYFSSLFADIISSSDCNSEEGCTIRLIDDDGFIVASNESDSEVGKFLGVLEGAVMMDFLNRSMFEKLTFTSVQEECKQSDVEQKESSARTLLNPLFAVTSYVQFWTQTVFWSLAQFSIYSFFSHNGVAMAEEEKQEEKKIPCSKELKFYKGVWDKRTIDEFQPCENSENCAWPVYMAPVPHTNLRLLVIKRMCACENNPKLTTSPQPLMSDPVSPRNVSYRKPPEFKPPCNDMQEQGKPPCALASLSSPQNVAMVFPLLVALFIPNNNIWR